ncbi:MAG: hypothetical protein F4Y63_06635 [Chloroflexi bacterium]|nr:hypothetical protein [Chloroflexota bacterium]MYF78474.1 hypothetical protein [Chloroflexota bacterium]MYK62046.1 hypothetical protein [Chloroflexota bacterium]
MKRLISTTSAIAIAVPLTLIFSASILAQSSSIATGVVTLVETGDDGGLTAFSIVRGDGNIQQFTVSSSNPNTEYGLENRVGDRWVSDQASNPQEAADRLRDQQRRLAQISVQSDDGGVAISVVQAESTDIDTNLGYLLAVVAIAWIAIMAYVLYLGVRQRAIATGIANLQNETDGKES